MAAQFTSDTGTPPLSPSVQQAVENLQNTEPVTAAALVDEILELHQSDYANGLGETLDLVVDDPSDEYRPVAEWLDEVGGLFDEQVVSELHGRAVIIGLSLLDRDLRSQLEQNGFITTLENEHREPLSEVLTETGQSLRPPTDLVPTHPDRPVANPDDDQLHRSAFARFLTHRIAGIERARAYSVNLYGPWGSGKSTLLNFMESELTDGVPTKDLRHWIGSTAAVDAPPGDEAVPTEWQVVRFNAWQNQHVEPPWWALMDNVYQQSKHHLDVRHRASEVWWRARSGRTPLFLGAVVLLWAGVLLLPPLLAGTPTVASLAQTAETLGTIFAVFATFLAGMKAATTSLFGGSAQAARSYVEYADDPMNTIQRRFNTLIDHIPRPVAIFIDDLDRCDATYVVELLEGIQTLFTDAPVVFVVAADRDWIEACFGTEYADQQSALDVPGRSLGGFFLEKTFQLSAPVPTIPPELKTRYWRSLLTVESGAESDEGHSEEVTGTDEASTSAGLDEETSEALEDAETEKAVMGVVDDVTDGSYFEQQPAREAAVLKLASPEIVAQTEHDLLPFAPLLEPNPRAMKRLVNAYSVNRALVTLGHLEIDKEPLTLWTILDIQYPDFAAHLADTPTDVARVGRAAPADAPENIRPLFTDEHVRKIVQGAPVEQELDETTVERCAKIRP